MYLGNVRIHSEQALVGRVRARAGRGIPRRLLCDANQVTQHIADINTQKATCFKVEDRAMITKAIESTLTQGFVTLNAVIHQRLRTWLTEITQAAVTKSRRGEERSAKHALTCNQAGCFLDDQGTFEKTLQFYEEALDIRLGLRPASRCGNDAKQQSLGPSQQGRFQDHTQVLSGSREIRREKLGDDHPDTKDVV